MATGKVLIIDDVASLRETLERMLSKDGFSVVCAANGSDGLLLAEESRPDLILLDAVMPGLDGHSLCRVLKRKPQTRSIPVIIMSGEMIEERDVVAGLEGGADDYLLKPFPRKILLARIHAVLRRYRQEPSRQETMRKYGIELDPEARSARVGGKDVSLARKEFDLLALFLANPGRVLKAGYLLETVWGYDIADYNDPHTIETHVSRLRKELGTEASEHLVNVRGYGYRFGE